jgi:hypothetical protein
MAEIQRRPFHRIAPAARPALAIALMALPAAIFYFFLWQNAVSIPILDDYDIILGSLNWLSQHHGVATWIHFLFTSQHNGYKLMFENAVVISEYKLLGQIFFLPLVFLGNSFPLLIFLIVAGMTLMKRGNVADRSILLIPVAWLIFQLQYASALDFASSSLQHLAVIFFSLLSIFLLDRDTEWTFWASCMVLILAVGSSPNGFFAGPVGLLMLAQSRRWRRLFAWVATLAVVLVVYLYGYYRPPATMGTDGASEHLGHVNLTYALSFLGSSAARYSSSVSSVTLGLLLCGVFALAVYRRYFRQNSAVFHSMVFILINAVAVSGLRSDLGVAQSLASRYRTYSNLFLALSWIFVIENLFPHWHSRSLRRGMLAAALTVSVAFCTLSDWAGVRFLQGKKQALTFCYRTEWQGQSPVDTHPASDADANPALLRQIDAGVYRMNLPVFREAVSRGIFHPPQNP